MARRAARAAPSLRSRADQEASAYLPSSLLQAEPVQAQLRAQCAKGRFGWIAVAARRLPRAERRRCDCLARGTGQRAGAFGARAGQGQTRQPGRARPSAAAAQLASDRLVAPLSTSWLQKS